LNVFDKPNGESFGYEDFTHLAEKASTPDAQNTNGSYEAAC